MTAAPPGTPEVKINKAAPPITLEWESAVEPDCGANCLYLFLALRGVPISREQALKEVPIAGQGASLLDLARACDKFGVSARALDVTPDQLAQLELPVIARMSARDANSAHYVVLTSVRDDDVSVIDGTSGEHYLVANWAFAQEFTGHVLGQPLPSRRLLWIGVGVIVVELGAIAALVVRRTRHG